jgi:hypothetical protein
MKKDYKLVLPLLVDLQSKNYKENIQVWEQPSDKTREVLEFE